MFRCQQSTRSTDIALSTSIAYQFLYFLDCSFRKSGCKVFPRGFRFIFMASFDSPVYTDPQTSFAIQSKISSNLAKPENGDQIQFFMRAYLSHTLAITLTKCIWTIVFICFSLQNSFPKVSPFLSSCWLLPLSPLVIFQPARILWILWILWSWWSSGLQDPRLRNCRCVNISSLWSRQIFPFPRTQTWLEYLINQDGEVVIITRMEKNNTITDGGSTAPLYCWYHTEEKTI